MSASSIRPDFALSNAGCRPPCISSPTESVGDTSPSPHMHTEPTAVSQSSPVATFVPQQTHPDRPIHVAQSTAIGSSGPPTAVHRSLAAGVTSLADGVTFARVSNRVVLRFDGTATPRTAGVITRICVLSVSWLNSTLTKLSSSELDPSHNSSAVARWLGHTDLNTTLSWSTLRTRLANLAHVLSSTPGPTAQSSRIISGS